MCLLAFFILVDVECLGTESDSEQEMQPANNREPQSLQCECQCCAQPDTAHQPMDVTESKTTHSHLSKERQASKLKCYSRKIATALLVQKISMDYCLHF